MRKIIAFITSCIMILSFAMPAFAATVAENGGAVFTPIKVSYELSSSQTEEVYYVDVSWGSFENTYKTNDTKIWNPETLMYEIEEGVPEWTCANGANTISVTNHSNTDVTVVLSYTPNAGYSNISADFDKSVIELAAPVENSSYDSAPKDSATFSLSGTLNGEAGAQIDVGTVKISFASESVGKISFVDSEVSYPIYEQGEGLYYASFTAVEDTKETDTIITVNGIDYYINEPHENRKDGHKSFHFSAGMTVNIEEAPKDLAYKKMTELYEGHSYTLVVNISAMTATLTEN